MKHQIVLMALLLSLFSVPQANADIIIDNFSDETNDRFTNSSSFIGAAFDFSGVGRSNRWGTLISNNVIISASHFRPSGEIAFYPGNDPNSTPVLRNIVAGSGLQLGGPGNRTDLFLSVLDAPVDSSISFYDFATETLSAPPFDPDTNNGLFDAGSFQDAEAFLFGLSPTNRSDTRIDQAVGRNRISGYIEDINFGSNEGNDSLLLLFDDPADPNYVPFEAQLQGGDSGAPLFIERNGELLLLGINTFISDSSSPDRFSGISFTGNFTNEINAFISLNAVPEPSSGGVITLALLLATTRRKRS